LNKNYEYDTIITRLYAALAGRSFGGFLYQTQGVAVGLEYIGLSARRMPMERIRRHENGKH